MRWSWWRRSSGDASGLPVGEVSGPGNARRDDRRRMGAATAHEEAVRRERLLAEHRRQAGSSFPTTPGALDPGGGWPSALNRE